MPMSDKLLYLCDAQALGNAGSEYTDDETNFGVTTPAANRGGKFGLHVVVTTAFATLTSGCIIWICHGASSSPTTKHTGMFIAVADLTAGAHFFIPCGSTPLLQYARGYFEVVSENATGGACDMWFGPGPDGAMD